MSPVENNDLPIGLSNALRHRRAHRAQANTREKSVRHAKAI